MNQEKVGKFIQDIRLKNNLTQKDFAFILGVTPQAVSKWENGKNIPDISILKIISEKYNVNIDEIINGSFNEKKENNIDIKYVVIIIGILLVSIISIILIINYHPKNKDFELKKIGTSCSDFEITGSAAYNNQNSSMYISNINYCGEKDDTVYQKIECNLYENKDSSITKVNSCKNGQNINLEEYLKDLTINVENYVHSCNKFQTKEFYIEINATTTSGNIKTYKIPLTLENTCN